MIPFDIQEQIAAASSREAFPLVSLREWLALVQADMAEVTTLQESITAKIKPQHPRLESREDEQVRLNAQHDARLLTTGFGRLEGFTDSRLLPRMGQPGLAQLQRWEVKLKNLIAEAEGRLAVEAAGTRPYRYTGPDYAHLMGDRRLAVGDVVELTPQQASAWHDRFEPVEEQVTS